MIFSENRLRISPMPCTAMHLLNTKSAPCWYISQTQLLFAETEGVSIWLRMIH